MYARMLQMQFQPEKVPLASEVAQDFVGEMEGLTEDLRNLKGFHGKHVLKDPSTGEFTVVTFFDTRDNALAYVGTFPQRRLGEIIERLSAISGSKPAIATCEVIGQVLPVAQLTPA